MPGSFDLRSSKRRPPLDADALLQALHNEALWRHGRNRTDTDDRAIRQFVAESVTTENRDVRLETAIELPRWQPQAAFEVKKKYKLPEFLAYHDLSFLDAAYLGILRRSPDDAGREHYLEELRSRKASRVWVLGALRYSAEGRTKGVSVRGLRLALVRHYLSRLPILGAFSEWVLNFFTLASTHNAISDAISRLESESQQMHRLINLQAGAAENIFRRQQSALAERPGVSAYTKMLDNLKHRHERSLTNKADKSALEALASSVELLREEYETFQRLSADARFSNDFYLSLEDRFRGSREKIYHRTRIHLPSVERAISSTGNGKLLDIGCGRGEWLEVLRDNNIEAYGVDNNSSMVDACRKLGLTVEEGDALTHLRNLQDNSLIGITAIHVVEHLPFGNVIALFEECRRVLKPGGVIICETPNPENLVVGACTFYLDPSHQRPIPPLLLEHVATNSGLVDVTICRLGLNKLTAETPTADAVVQSSRTLSWLFDMASSTLVVPGDYAVIGYTPVESAH